MFYAQKFEEIEITDEYYSLSDQFQQIEDIFDRITKEKLSEYKTKASTILNSIQRESNDKSKAKSDSLPEKKEQISKNRGVEKGKTPYRCSECGRRISKRVYHFSNSHFHDSLCFDCQTGMRARKPSGCPPKISESGIYLGGKDPKRKPFHDGY